MHDVEKNTNGDREHPGEKKNRELLCGDDDGLGNLRGNIRREGAQQGYFKTPAVKKDTTLKKM